MLYIGIDPGQTGAIAALSARRIVGLWDFPTVPRVHGKGNEVAVQELWRMLRQWTGPGKAEVIVERVNAMPKQGVTSSFNFGRTFGAVEGILAALELPVVYCRPVEWKRAMGLIGKDKGAARSLAMQRHPEVADMLTRVKDHNRADAILLADYLAEKSK